METFSPTPQAARGWLAQRWHQPEMMDDPFLEEPRHIQALQGLERVNRWSLSARVLWPPLLRLAQSSARPLCVLDIATGAGDVPIALSRRARRCGWDWRIDACDASPRAVAYARRRAEDAGEKLGFFVWNASTDAVPAGYDVVMASLFLHHLATEAGVRLLSQMAQAARRMMLVSDLVRSTAGFALAWIGTRLLSSSSVVRADGPASVLSAYTVEEARALAREAGLRDAVIDARWPCRFLLCWEKS